MTNFSSSKRNVRQKGDKCDDIDCTGGMEGKVKGTDGTSQLLERAFEDLCDKSTTRKLQYRYRIARRDDVYVVDVVVQKNEEREDTICVNVVRIEQFIPEAGPGYFSYVGAVAFDEDDYSKRTIYPGSKDFARLVPQEWVELECQRRVKEDDRKYLTDIYDIVRSKICPYITSVQNA